MGRGDRLEGEGSGDSVLVLADGIRQGGPASGYGSIVRQREADGGDEGEVPHVFSGCVGIPFLCREHVEPKMILDIWRLADSGLYARAYVAYTYQSMSFDSPELGESCNFIL